LGIIFVQIIQIAGEIIENLFFIEDLRGPKTRICYRYVRCGSAMVNGCTSGVICILNASIIPKVSIFRFLGAKPPLAPKPFWKTPRMSRVSLSNDIKSPAFQIYLKNGGAVEYEQIKSY
jgi:hypothetical protein